MTDEQLTKCAQAIDAFFEVMGDAVLFTFRLGYSCATLSISRGEWEMQETQENKTELLNARVTHLYQYL